MHIAIAVLLVYKKQREKTSERLSLEKWFASTRDVQKTRKDKEICKYIKTKSNCEKDKEKLEEEQKD